MNVSFPTLTRTAAEALVDQLVLQGVERVTCVPGESYLAVLDALVDTDIDVLTCRNEGGAAMMAEAEGKLTGRPGICMVTRGPGATNAAAGVHIAAQDSTPMILFVGQIDNRMRGREAVQELDYRAVFGSVAKWVAEIDHPERMSEMVARAFRVAMQGRPGPVVLALPENILSEPCPSIGIPRIEPVRAAPDPQAMVQLGAMLGQAKAPIAIVGGSGWTPEARQDLVDFAERFDLPVATSFRRADRFPPLHRCYAGDLGIGPDPALKTRVDAADLILLVGGRLSEMPSLSYTLLGVPKTQQKLVHVHAGAEELGRVYQPDLAIQASPVTFAAVLAELDPPAHRPWAGGTEQAHAAYLRWSGEPRVLPGDFQYGEVLAWMARELPEDTILCNGAGNYAGWLGRHYRYRAFGTQLAPTSGSMGYGVPAAVMAKRMFPERLVVAVAGDGCFQMNGQEFATAVQYGIAPIVVVIDNSQLGTIRMHQEREYPGRRSATELVNPDFAALARACGGHGETVRNTAEFAPAFERARASGKAAILHCFLDRRAQSHARDHLAEAAS